MIGLRAHCPPAAMLVPSPASINLQDENATWSWPLEFVLEHTTSCFAHVIRARIREGRDEPTVECFTRGGDLFAKVEWTGPGTRWLVLALDPIERLAA